MGLQFMIPAPGVFKDFLGASHETIEISSVAAYQA